MDKEEGSSFLALILEQFDDPLVKILLVAAVLSTGIGIFVFFSLSFHTLFSLLFHIVLNLIFII